MQKPKKVEWLPVWSFACLLFLLFCAGTLIEARVGAALVVVVITIITTVSSILDDHYKSIKWYWFKKIYPESHKAIIWISISLGMFFVLILGKQYVINIKIEKNG